MLLPKLLRFVAVAGAVALAAGPAGAAIQVFTASLDGAQETPDPVPTNGTGTATLEVDDVTLAWTLTGSFQDLTGLSSNAHVHGPSALGGLPAGVLFGITFDSGVTSGALGGNGTMTAQHFQYIQDGLAYINVHSSFRPGGEIRGQLVPEPASLSLLGLGSLLLARRRRRI